MHTRQNIYKCVIRIPTGHPNLHLKSRSSQFSRAQGLISKIIAWLHWFYVSIQLHCISVNIKRQLLNLPFISDVGTVLDKLNYIATCIWYLCGWRVGVIKNYR